MKSFQLSCCIVHVVPGIVDPPSSGLPHSSLPRYNYFFFSSVDVTIPLNYFLSHDCCHWIYLVRHNCESPGTFPTWSVLFLPPYIIKHIHFSDRNVMLRSVSDRIDGGSPGVCVWEIGQVLPGLCFFFLGNPSVVQTWAGRIGWMFQCSCWSASS